MEGQVDIERERGYLIGVAYRMLGSRSDAEDIVQEALVRGAQAEGLRSPRAFLTTVVTRLCLDELRSARRRRETYVGPFLPEPIATDGLDAAAEPPAQDPIEHRENVSFALLTLLDQLSPLERAVFVLRELFDLEFGEIADALGRSQAACRKLLQRARAHVRRGQPAPAAPSAQQTQVANAFFQAVAEGDLQGLVSLLAEQAKLTTDHGGKASAARRILHGREVVARFLRGLVGKLAQLPQGLVDVQLMPINGSPGVVARWCEGGQVEAVFVFDIRLAGQRAQVDQVFVVRNPDKLGMLARLLEAGTPPLPVSSSTAREAQLPGQEGPGPASSG